MRRREFLLGSLSLLAGGPLFAQAKADVFSSPLYFFHTHTSETLEVACSHEGIEAGQRQAVNHLLRDFRTEEITTMDENLLLQLAELIHKNGHFLHS